MKIVSGGQTGADLGALVAARELDIPTGGWMPKGFLTEVGPAPAMRELYGMREHRSRDYVPRTRRNVKDSDGTVWISADETDSRGKQATRAAVQLYGKPFIENPTAEKLRQWIKMLGIQTLNVAGPRASRDPQAFDRARRLILDTFGDTSGEQNETISNRHRADRVSAARRSRRDRGAAMTDEQIKALARDIDFAIDVTEPREVLLSRFEDAIRAALAAPVAAEPPSSMARDGWEARVRFVLNHCIATLEDDRVGGCECDELDANSRPCALCAAQVLLADLYAGPAQAEPPSLLTRDEAKRFPTLHAALAAEPRCECGHSQGRHQMGNLGVRVHCVDCGCRLFKEVSAMTPTLPEALARVERRYALIEIHPADPAEPIYQVMQERDDGDWVRYEDYAKVAAEAHRAHRLREALGLMKEVADSLESAYQGEGVVSMFRVARFEADRLRRLTALLETP